MYDYDFETGDRVQVNGKTGELFWFDSSGYYVSFDEVDEDGNSLSGCYDIDEIRPIKKRAAQSTKTFKKTGR